MIKALVPIDMLNDFVHRSYEYNDGISTRTFEGKLVVPRGIKIVDRIFDLMKDAESRGYSILFLEDEHTKDSPEIKSGEYPEHSMLETPGSLTIEELSKKEFCTAVTIKKDSPSVFDTNKEAVIDWIQNREIEEVYLVGLADEICIKANALGFLKGKVKVNIIAGATASFDLQKGIIAFGELAKKGVTFVEGFE